MAITGDPFASGDLSPRIPEVWENMILEEQFAKTTAASWFRDHSNEVATEGDIINIADVYTNSFTSKTQSTQGDEITTESPAQQNVTITVDTHRYIALLLGDMDSQQLLSDFDFNQVYTSKAGKTLKNDLESDLYGLWSNITTNTVGSSSTVLKDVDLRSAMGKLESNDWDLEDLAYHFHPDTYWEQVLGIQKLYDASQRGMMRSPQNDGAIGEQADKARGVKGVVYGAPVYVSSNIVSNLTSRRNLLAHKDTFGYANQTPVVNGGNGVRVQAEYQLPNLANLVVIDQILGADVVREDAAVRIDASTTAST